MVPSAPSVQCSSKSEGTFLSSHALYLLGTYCLVLLFLLRVCKENEIIVPSYLSVWLMETHVVFKLIWHKWLLDVTALHIGCYLRSGTLNLNLLETWLPHVQLRGLLRSFTEFRTI